MDENDSEPYNKDNFKNKPANIAIFWDIENVTPKRGSFFADGLLEYAESIGKVIVQNAYADWSEKRFHQLGLDLAQHNFYMVHLPHRRKSRSKSSSDKNSADIQLVSDALDSLRVYEHIDNYILVTGDSDFRPLLRPLRRMGKTIHIICDIRNASQDLLMIADSFQDFHELLPSGDDEPEVEQKAGRQSGKDQKGSQSAKEGKEDKGGGDGKAGRKELRSKQDQSYWFNQLCEALQAMEAEDKNINLSTLRIRMRMLNPGFDERELGFRRWSQFIAAAVKNNFIRIDNNRDEEREGEQVISVVEQPRSIKSSHTLTLQKAIQELLAILKQANSGSEADKDADEEGYLLYGILNSRLRERGINVEDLGFNQFKKFMASAEARGLIETKLESMNYSARLASDRSMNEVKEPKKDKDAAEAAPEAESTSTTSTSSTKRKSILGRKRSRKPKTSS